MVELFATMFVVTTMVGLPLFLTAGALLVGYCTGRRIEAARQRQNAIDRHRRDTVNLASMPTSSGSRWKRIVR